MQASPVNTKFSVLSAPSLNFMPPQALEALPPALRPAAARECPPVSQPSRPMRVLEARVFRGPSIYAYRTVIRLKLDLGELEHFPTDEIPGFSERLLAAVPTLQEHTCSYDEPGGFVRRLRDGTWMGHVIEHIAIELQQLAGIDVTYGKTRGAGEGEGVYHIVYAYREERVGLRAGWLAIRLIDSLLPPE